MNLEQVAACVPFIGMTKTSSVPPVYMRIIVGVLTALIIGAGSGITAIVFTNYDASKENDKATAVILEKLEGMENLYKLEINAIKDRLTKLEDD